MEKKFLNFEVETNSNEEEDNKENNKEIKNVNKKCIIIIIASILLVIVIAVILLVVLLNNNNTSNTSNNPQNIKFYKTEITDEYMVNHSKQIVHYLEKICVIFVFYILILIIKHMKVK